MMLWRRTHHMDPKAVALADKHYNRRVIGSPEFVAPGYKVVFVLPGYKALWASHTPSSSMTPGAARQDGLDCWDCSVFRNESNRLASVLIRQAVAATLDAWAHRPLPADGFITYINERKVAPLSNGRPYGWTYLEAGWQVIGRSKVRDLLCLQLPRDALAQVVPRRALWLGGVEQRSLLDAV